MLEGGCPEIQSCFRNPGVRGKGLNKSDDGENGQQSLTLEALKGELELAVWLREGKRKERIQQNLEA